MVLKDALTGTRPVTNNNKNKCCFVQVVGGARLLKLWDPVPEGPFSSLRTLTNEAERLWTCPRDGAAMA